MKNLTILFSSLNHLPFKPEIMKNLILVLLLAGCSMSAFAQKGNVDSQFYKTLSTQKNVDPVVRKLSADLSRNNIMADSLLNFTASFEKAILQGRSGGAIQPELVKEAMKKYPGNNIKAVNSRLRIYATEGKKSLNLKR
jgi:hypothetical protein